MSKKRRDQDTSIPETAEDTRNSVQNLPPSMPWLDFNQFWSIAVKNGTPLLKDSFRAHLKALGWLEKPERYVEGALHFGIEIEKKKR